jgi:hypothetical protein
MSHSAWDNGPVDERDFQREFLRRLDEILRRHGRVIDRIGERVEANTAAVYDMREQIQANTRAVLAVLDRLENGGAASA